MNIMLKRLMFVPGLLAFIFIVGCEPSMLDLASFDAADASLDEDRVIDPVEALAWCQGSVAILNPGVDPPELQDDLNGLVEPDRALTLEPDMSHELNQNKIGDRCDPSIRYLSRHEICIGCDGICIGVEWPLGARTGHYAFACVSAAELASSPDALEGRKTSLCRRAGPLFAYCGFMSVQGWREIYYNERQCTIEPGL